jgi:hypothetical protein
LVQNDVSISGKKEAHIIGARSSKFVVRECQQAIHMSELVFAANQVHREIERATPPFFLIENYFFENKLNQNKTKPHPKLDQKELKQSYPTATSVPSNSNH